ncbi:hypothetical protein BGX34_002913 [Mortierella sp. NVP85]|nr:hypothetical protein BGX34_002913 [Mortierella sp. NVP85]
MLSTPSEAASCPHGYLYALDLPRLHRIIRPLKAKIAAVQLAIKSSPSFGFTSTVPPSVGPSSGTTTAHIGSSDGRTRRKAGRHQDEQPWSFRQSAHNRNPTSSKQQHELDGGDMVQRSCGRNGEDVLVKRFQTSMTDLIKDVVEKLWWQPFCDDYDLPLTMDPASAAARGLVPDGTTLKIRCAFAVGSITANISDDTKTMEKYYRIMPPYMRRFALLQHAIEMCAQVPVGGLIIPLVRVCAKYRADAQALRLLEHLATLPDTIFELDHEWSYKMALHIESGDAWTDILLHSCQPRFFTTKVFQKFLQQAHPRHRASLIQASFDAHMDPLFVTKWTRRSRIIYWTSLLIKDSLTLNEEGSSVGADHRDTTFNRCNDAIQHMGRSLFTDGSDDSSMEIASEMDLVDVAIALALHSLYVVVTGATTTGDSRVHEWTLRLKMTMSNCFQLEDFSLTVKIYQTLTRLNALALVLDAVGLYGLSMRLMSKMLEDFDRLERATRQQLGHECDITESSLERQLRDVQSRRLKDGQDESWRFDDILGDWVKKTPQVKKTALFNLDDDSDNDGYESGDADPAKPDVRPIFDDLKGNEASSDEETWLESSLLWPRYGNRLNKRFVLDSDSEESVTAMNDHQESTMPDNVEDLVAHVDEESEYHTDDAGLDDDPRSTNGSDILSEHGSDTTPEHGSDTTPEHESNDGNESSSSSDSSQGETEAPLKRGHTVGTAIVLSSDDETDEYNGRSVSLKKSGNRPLEPVVKSRLRSARKDMTPTNMLLRRSARSQTLSKQEGRYSLRSLTLNCDRSTTLETEELTSDEDSEKSDGIERNRSPRTPIEGQPIPSTVISRMKRYDRSRARSGSSTDSFLGTSRKRRYARVDRKKSKWARRDDDSDSSYSQDLKDEEILYEESNSEGESDRTADKTEQAFNLSFHTNEPSSGQDHDNDSSDYQDDDDSDDTSSEDDYNARIRVVTPLPVTRPDELGFFL